MLLTALTCLTLASAPPSLEARAEALAKSTGDDFTVVVEAPFIVAGDEAPEMVRRRAAGTVRWAAERLKQDFFESDPPTIEIWLFRDSRSYLHHARTRFGDTPDTPYGYYSPTHRALVMNIATGGGTLVHEMVHPFMRANYPACPPWLDEGLASLFEQSDERDGHIRGLTNWRLEGLQQAIRANTVPSFHALTHLDADGFYGEGSGLHYAQARYLLYYVQEQGLLVRFFKEAKAHHAEDPTGYETLKRVLGVKDVAQFEREWKRFVLGLRFGG